MNLKVLFILFIELFDMQNSGKQKRNNGINLILSPDMFHQKVKLKRGNNVDWTGRKRTGSILSNKDNLNSPMNNQSENHVTFNESSKDMNILNSDAAIVKNQSNRSRTGSELHTIIEPISDAVGRKPKRFSRRYRSNRGKSQLKFHMNNTLSIEPIKENTIVRHSPNQSRSPIQNVSLSPKSKTSFGRSSKMRESVHDN
jgi:hypothetical protein